MTRLMKATLFGVIAAIVGAMIYFAILKFTGYEVGLVAILVGFMVGKAVIVGSGGRGGAVYQFIAVSLTYLAIVSTYAPFIFEGLADHDKTEIAMQLGVLLALPFLAGFENIIGLLIIGFGLFQAWALTKKTELSISGPYQIQTSED